MAKTGCKYLVYAPYTSGGDGSAIVYGTGGWVAHLIEANLTRNNRDNPLHGDNVTIENDRGITDYNLTLNTDRLPGDMRVALLGEEVASSVYSVVDASAPYVGVGYYHTLLEDNVAKYEAFWCHKVQFQLDEDSATTKTEQIDWGTYSLNGRGMGVELDATGKVTFYDHEYFDTEAAAKAWLDAKIGNT